MSLVVEDGTGIANANTYISLADVSSYCLDFDFEDFFSKLEAEQNALILKSMRFIESFDFVGTKNQTENNLQWPRDDAYERNGLLIDSSTIPANIKNAVCEGVILEATSSGILQPSLSRQGLKSEKYGDVKFEYFSSGRVNPSFLTISGLLVGLVKSSHVIMRS